MRTILHTQQTRQPFESIKYIASLSHHSSQFWSANREICEKRKCWYFHFNRVFSSRFPMVYVCACVCDQPIWFYLILAHCKNSADDVCFCICISTCHSFGHHVYQNRNWFDLDNNQCVYEWFEFDALTLAFCGEETVEFWYVIMWMSTDFMKEPTTP